MEQVEADEDEPAGLPADRRAQLAEKSDRPASFMTMTSPSMIADFTGSFAAASTIGAYSSLQSKPWRVNARALPRSMSSSVR